MSSRLKWLWTDRRYLIGRQWDALVRWVAWRLPRRLVMWCYFRVGAHATTGRYGNTIVPELTMMDAIKRWDEVRDGRQVH
jgi:hypothetical protein